MLSPAGVTSSGGSNLDCDSVQGDPSCDALCSNDACNPGGLDAKAAVPAKAAEEATKAEEVRKAHLVKGAAEANAAAVEANDAAEAEAAANAKVDAEKAVEKEDRCCKGQGQSPAQDEGQG